MREHDAPEPDNGPVPNDAVRPAGERSGQAEGAAFDRERSATADAEDGAPIDISMA